MKRSFTAVAAAFVLSITMLFGGCREGGYGISSGNSAEESVEELDFGERGRSSAFSSHSSSVYSSSAISSASAESRFSSTVSDSVSSNASSPVTSSSGDVPIVVIVSSQSGFSESSVQSSSAPITVVVPEYPAQSSSFEEIAPPDDTSADQNAVPAIPDDIPVQPPEESSIGVSTEPETSVSPYDYEGTVYVASSGNGTKYHIDPSCSNMKGVTAMDVQEALMKGYTPCKKCW